MKLQAAHVRSVLRKGANQRGTPEKRGIVDGSKETDPEFEFPPAPRERTRGRAQRPGLGRYKTWWLKQENRAR